jgi:hypothetical protein
MGERCGQKQLIGSRPNGLMNDDASIFFKHNYSLGNQSGIA